MKNGEKSTYIANELAGIAGGYHMEPV